MARTTKIALGLLALSAAFVLASCDSINALPKTYNDPIVEHADDNDAKLDDNQLGKIWEAIVSGKAEKIHNEIIYRIAEQQFGTYFGEGGIYSISKTDTEAIKAFVNAHPSVFVREEDATLAGSEDENVIFDKVRKERFLAFKADIDERLAEKLYAEIDSKNYNDKQGRFSELKLALAHYFSGYTIEGLTWDNGVAQAGDWHVSYITSAVSKDDLESIKKVIYVERYADYLNKKVLRDIYSEKLIEEYVLNNHYSTLGRAYARKVSYVKLAYDTATETFADKLLRYYAKEVIYGTSVTARQPKLEKVANTWRGIYDLRFSGTVLAEIKPGENYTSDLGTLFTPASIKDRLETAYGVADLYTLVATSTFTAEEKVVLEYDYIKESKVGAHLENYLQAVRAVIGSENHWKVETEEQSQLDSFTGSNSHSRVKGIKDKLAELVLEDYTVDEEWGLKNGGFSELPSDVRDRLFNINVANAVDNFEHYEGDSETPLGNYAKSGKFNYVRDIYGYYYLNKSNAERYEDDDCSFLFNKENSYTIVNVEEAVTTTKLNVEHESGYLKSIHPEDPFFTERTAREIAKLLGTKESYKTEAYQHYLEEYKLSFSDQELYDYFVSAYPDLYGENA